MTISKCHLKQRAYKHIARPADTAGNTRSLGKCYCKSVINCVKM